MKLFIGLGNPGAGHARNRHNVGFMAIDAIAAAHGFGPWRKKFQGTVAEGRMGGEKCLLLKPGTYMNESGRAAAEAVRFYKLEPDDVIVLHDEIDLAPAKVRVKTGGGVAGHNGLKSLTRHIGNDYVRVRIGIGHPGSKAKVHAHVLKDFSRAEQVWLAPLIGAIAASAPLLAEENAANFMNEVSRAANGDAVKSPAPKTKTAPEKTGKKPLSQRDLARMNARGASDTGSKQPEPAQEQSRGPFARLRKLFGASGEGR